MNGWKPTSWRFGSNDFREFNWVIFRFHHNFVRFHIPSWIGLVGDLFYGFYHGKSPLFTTIYLYGHPPPWSTYKHFIWELPVFYAHFFLPEKWHSHVSISFTYYVSCRPRHTHMQFCFCLLFCHFLRFWSKTQKTLRKPKKQKKQNCKTHVGTSWWVRVCNFVFLVFFGFLEVFNTFGQKPKKHWENQKKQKKQNCKTHVGTSWWVRVCNFVFFVFFGFLEVFNTFGQKPKKHWENQKKPKKPKLQDPCRYKPVS